MSSITTTNPAARRTYSRRKMLAKWLRDPRWKQMLAEHAYIPEAECVYCHRKHGQIWNGKPVRLTINHASRHLYLSEELYLTWDSQYMEITCLSCNRKYERGMKPCPSCLKKGKMVYILDRDSECNPCYMEKNPVELQRTQECQDSFKKSIKDYNSRRADKNRDDKAARPCVSWKVGNTCAISGVECPFTKSRMMTLCPDAVSKKKFVKIPFPCDRRMLNQKCRRKPGLVCSYNRTTCKTKCGYFKERQKL